MHPARFAMSDGSFSPVAAARTLLRTVRTGALATLATGSGDPFASLVTVATLPDGSPIVLLSDLALHTRNLTADPRASLLFAASGAAGDPLAGARVSVAGRMRRLAPGTADDDMARRRFLMRHPDAAGYAGFADFAIWALAVSGAHLVAGFGRIVEIAADDLLVGLEGAEPLLASEKGAVDHMNEDHTDALALYATRLCGAAEGPWISTGVDPDGIDLMTRDGRQTARLPFGERVRTSAELRGVLVKLAQAARASA
jgi:putative heme iron utilization protein